MKHVPIKEAEGRLQELVSQLEAGEKLVLTKDGEAVAELSLTKPERRGGVNWEALEQWKKDRGVDRIVTYIADDFDDPLPEDFLITPEQD
jgi:antitoxin (DNA-binding transcriptional repressor) of toxin-antitoxin stability system